MGAGIIVYSLLWAGCLGVGKMDIRRMIPLRMQKQQLQDQIVILRRELYDLRDKIIEAKIDLQEEEKKLAWVRKRIMLTKLQTGV